MKNTICLMICGLLLLTQTISVTAACPSWGAPYNEDTRGCPNLFKVVYTDMFWYYSADFISAGRTWGQGSCLSGHECWPQFKEPVREESTGPDNNFYYRYVVHQVDELAAFRIHASSIGCAVANTRFYRFPEFDLARKCPKPVAFNNASDCQVNGYSWNFSEGTCHEEPQACGGHCAPYYPLEGGMCESATDYCGFQWGCSYSFTDGGSGCCCVPTPILIDVAGNGFSLTNAYDGVHFDMGGDGHSEPIAWTTAGTDDAWLVLDRNGNGRIDSAKEMFGNFTDQPNATDALNGFVALSEFDRTDQGGNNDREITSSDSVFANLRLWQDTNKNGESESAELHTLSSLGVSALELKYKKSKKADNNGNEFSYRAKVKDVHGAQVGRWAWDVTLSVNPPPR